MTVFHVLAHSIPITTPFHEAELDGIPRVVLERWVRAAAQWAVLHVQQVLQANELEHFVGSRDRARRLASTVNSLINCRIVPKDTAYVQHEWSPQCSWNAWVPGFNSVTDSAQGGAVGYQMAIWWALDQIAEYWYSAESWMGARQTRSADEIIRELLVCALAEYNADCDPSTDGADQ